MHEWKVGDVAYAAMRGFCGEEVEVSSAEVHRVGKGFVELSQRELAWKCRARVRPTEVHPTRTAALEAFATQKTAAAAELESKAGKLRSLAEQARKMAEGEP